MGRRKQHYIFAVVSRPLTLTRSAIADERLLSNSGTRNSERENQEGTQRSHVFPKCCLEQKVKSIFLFQPFTFRIYQSNFRDCWTFSPRKSAYYAENSCSRIYAVAPLEVAEGPTEGDCSAILPLPWASRGAPTWTIASCGAPSRTTVSQGAPSWTTVSRGATSWTTWVSRGAPSWTSPFSGFPICR